MLLINKTLIDMSKGFRHWIVLIALLKFVVLVGITQFSNSLAAVLGALGTGASGIGGQLMRAFLAALIMLAGNLLVGEAEFRCTARARLSLRRRILTKVLELDVGDVDKLGATRTINAAVDGVETMQVYYNRYLPGLVYGILAPVYLFFALKDQCLAAAVVLLCSAIVIMPLNNMFRSVIEKLKTRYWHDLGDLTSYFLESLNSLTTTELFGRSQDREQTLRGKAQHLSDTIISVMRTNFSSAGFNEILMNVAIFLSTAIVCIQLIQGKITLGTALTVLLLSYSFFGSIRQIQWIAHDALMGIGATQNVVEILNIDTEKPVRPRTEPESDFRGVRFENVTFAYEGRESVLKNVSLQIPEGKVTAIVGESGCGKSTIVNMLLRFYDAQCGKITFNGQDYLSIPPEKLRRQINMVPQSVFIFSGSVRENLLLADPKAHEPRLWEALEQVKLADWVKSQPEGLDAPVGDGGSRLSGGQRQKLGIARALLSRAPYIVFDEATSAVDEESEREIWDCLGLLSRSRTLIMISHRLSTIRGADCIFVLEDGKVAEYGDHEQLMKNGGLYSRLVTEQNILEERGERRRSHVETV